MRLIAVWCLFINFAKYCGLGISRSITHFPAPTVMTEEGSSISFKFPKEERLRHRSLVDGIFHKGKSFFEFPFRVFWRVMSREDLEKNFSREVPQGIGRVQLLVTVPKKKRRKAVDRVKMRRRIREAYRLNKHMLLEAVDSRPDISTLSVAIIYSYDKNLEYKIVEEKVKVLMEKVIRKIDPPSQN